MTTTKAWKVECVHLVLFGNAFGKRDHVKAGDNQPVNQDEWDAIAGDSPTASAVKYSPIYGRPPAT